METLLKALDSEENFSRESHTRLCKFLVNTLHRNIPRAMCQYYMKESSESMLDRMISTDRCWIKYTESIVNECYIEWFSLIEEISEPMIHGMIFPDGCRI